MKKFILGTIITLIALGLWWRSGYKTYQKRYVFEGQPANIVGQIAQCHEWPIGAFWRVGKWPELLQEGECH